MYLSEETMFAILHQQQLMKSRKIRKIRAMEDLQLQGKEAKVTPVLMRVVGLTQLHPLLHLLPPVPPKLMLTEKL